MKIDETVNRSARMGGTISVEGSAVKVLIIQADEETIVARETVNVVRQTKTVRMA